LYYVYMTSNINKNVLYIGVRSDLSKRIYQHKNKLVKGFTDKYNCDRLVYYEAHSDITEAIKREKQLKGWKQREKRSINRNF